VWCVCAYIIEKRSEEREIEREIDRERRERGG
jgi:hypothetical protein